MSDIFAYDFQDPSTDNQFTDITGNNHPMGIASIGMAPIRSSDFALPGKTYSMKTYASDQCWAVTNAPIGPGWADGLATFTLDWWYRSTTPGRGLLVGNQYWTDSANFWGVLCNGDGEVYVKRFGQSGASTHVPPTDRFVHYVCAGDGATVRVYADNEMICSCADAAGDGDGNGGLLWIREQQSSILGPYFSLAGYYGAVNAADTVWEPVPGMHVSALFGGG